MTSRYARQTVLPEIGTEGQERLRLASVLCVGCGGLGSPALLYMAASGIGRIGIVDDDRVDVSNLQRQVLFRESGNGHRKTDAARLALEGLNSECAIETHPVRLNAANAEQLIAGYDIVLDGTDNFSSKFLLNDACVKSGKPLVHASILGFQAQVAVFLGKDDIPCYRCLYPEPPTGHVPNCAEAGVIGALAGIAGTVQALEVIKLALGMDWCREKGLEPLTGRLWLLDARTMNVRTLHLSRQADCPVCSLAPASITLADLPAPACTTVQAITSADAAALADKVLFVDVREPHEWQAGHIPGAYHWPLGALLAADTLPLAVMQETPVIVYCQQGVRSLRGAAQLQELGVRNIFQLDGGFAKWNSRIF